LFAVRRKRRASGAAANLTNALVPLTMKVPFGVISGIAEEDFLLLDVADGLEPVSGSLS